MRLGIGNSRIKRLLEPRSFDVEVKNPSINLELVDGDTILVTVTLPKEGDTSVFGNILWLLGAGHLNGTIMERLMAAPNNDGAVKAMVGMYAEKAKGDEKPVISPSKAIIKNFDKNARING